MRPIPTFPREGGCLCGAVRYRLIEDAVELHACHCTDCQALTGSAFVLSMIIKRESITLDRGSLERIEYETRSGIHHIDQRCPDCGVRLWSESRRFPNLLTLRPGTLDDTSWFEPVSHIWTRSAQPWVEIPDDTLNHPRQPDDEEVLAAVRAWKSRS